MNDLGFSNMIKIIGPLTVHKYFGHLLIRELYTSFTMRTKAKNRLLFVLVFIFLLIAFAFWYKHTYAMEVTENAEINSAQFEKKIWIGTQGSDFKNAVVTNIVNFYRKDSVYVKVTDVSQLQQITPQTYHVIILLHTWEYGKPPSSVTQFLNDNEDIKNRMIVFTTSGAGNNKMEGIDAMAGESILENASDVSDAIIEKTEFILAEQVNF